MKLSFRDFEKLWGTSLTPTAINEIEQLDFEYEPMDISDENTLITEIREEIRQNKFVKAGQSREASWEKGWDENLQNFIKSKDSTPYKSWLIHCNSINLTNKYYGKN